MTDLVSRVLSAITSLEQCAEAAGHGFGHLPLNHELNGGWTQLDLSQNVRPTYDQRFLRALGPDQAKRLCQSLRDIVTLHQPGSDPCDAHDAGMRSVPCEVIELVARGLGIEDKDQP